MRTSLRSASHSSATSSIVPCAPWKSAPTQCCTEQPGERDVNGQKERRWFRSGAGGKHQEFVALVAGVLNTIRSEKAKRSGLPFGCYLSDEGPIIPQE